VRTISSAARKRCPDGACRDEDGIIRRKRSDTLVGTLRREYGDDFARGFRGDTKLATVLRETDSTSLNDYLRRRQPAPGRPATARDTARTLGVSETRADELINTVSEFRYRDRSGVFIEKKKTGETHAKARTTKTNGSEAHR
jgi:hypothetical protein